MSVANPGSIEEQIRAHEGQGLLRLITCGSVDDGKSTLIGRLLYETQAVLEDQLAALESDSRRIGTQGDGLDFALLLDGLSSEREQGITIDVAYRFFSTGTRKFIVADAPGHEQYTRNMVTGASTADVAVLLVDSRKGITTQTRRHSYLVRLLGIRTVALAVNKLDLVDYSREVAERIEAEYAGFAAQLGIDQVTSVPLSALHGDNVIAPSANTPWYDGPTLLEWLESVQPRSAPQDGPFRMPVQWVSRPDSEFRGFAGQIVGGTVRVGDAVVVAPSGSTSAVARIVTADGDLEEAVTGESVTVTLADEVDVSRGDVLCAAQAPADDADQFQAHVVWMDEAPLIPGRPYLLKLGTRTVGASVWPKFKVDVSTLEHLAAPSVELNEIAVANLSLDAPVAYDPYAENRDMGGFILIDRLTSATVGAGMLDFALRRSHNVHWQALEVGKDAHAALKGHRPCVVWFTGLSGAGKSTIANMVEKRLHALGVHTCTLDGDNVRHGLNRDLGFTEPDRVENIRRVGEVASLMVDAGLVVLVSFISPFRAERRMARRLVAENEFVEVFVDTPLAVAEQRDPKGLYRKARSGELPNFTGIDSAYEPPEHPDVRVETVSVEPAAAAELIVERLRTIGVLGSSPSGS